MESNRIESVITDEFLKELFPLEKADEFFEALYGGVESGAFDILLKSAGFNETGNVLHLEFRLRERPGKCLACNLTYGLPQVFARHPVIDLEGIVNRIGEAVAPDYRVKEWRLGSTMSVGPKEDAIPLEIMLEKG